MSRQTFPRTRPFPRTRRALRFFTATGWAAMAFATVAIAIIFKVF